MVKKLVQGLAAVSVLATSVSTTAMAKSVNYVVDDPKGRDIVSFTSDAPVELIVGRTNKIKGQISVDDSLDLTKQPIQANFEVDLASIDTGIPLRNEHMRDNFLETAKYPKAIFKVKTIGQPTVLKDGQKATVKATGEFSLHGKTVARDIPVDVTYFKNCKTTQGKFENCDLMQIKSTFPVPFKDYAIKRPEIVFQKLADTVLVTVAATARHEVPKESATEPARKPMRPY